MNKLEQIQALTLLDRIDEILERVLNLSVVPEDETIYSIDADDTKTDYERIFLNPELVKPSEARLVEELDEIKAELTVIENARLAEIARVADLNSRWQAMTDIRGAILKANLPIMNPALELKRIIDEDDQDRMVLLETSYAQLRSDIQAEAALEAEDAAIQALFDAINGCIKIVVKFNIAAQLTKEQKDQQAVMYSDAFTALNNYRPSKFKSIISALTPDGILVTEELKTTLVSYLTNRGL